MSIKWTIFLVFASVIITGAYFVFMVEDELALYARDCNIAGISLRGDLMTYIPPDYYSESGEQIYDAASSEDIVSRIREADKNENIKAVLLEVDSYGGYPVAAEEVMRALLDSSKPSRKRIGPLNFISSFSGRHQAFSPVSRIIIGESLMMLDKVKPFSSAAE